MITVTLFHFIILTFRLGSSKYKANVLLDALTFC